MDFSAKARRSLAHLVYRLYGIDIFSFYKWLLATTEWTPEQRERWRLKRLGDILEFAWENVPFYREYWGDHGVSFFRPRNLDELQRYPVLSKDIFRENASKIRPKELNGIRYREWHTGGTTGEPVHYLRDLEQWTLCEAFHLWGWSQIGYSFGDPIGVIAGGSLIPERWTLENKIRAFLHNRHFLYGFTMNEETARAYHIRLAGRGVKYLYGYPSIIYLLGKYIADLGLKIPTLKAVVTTAEMLLPQYRKGIEESFRCPVYNNLGCNDGGYESYECSEHNGLHYNDLQSILEVDSDGKDAEGKLLITNLWNKSTPFIRYENGDLVSLKDSLCPCGAPFPLISSIQGRTSDILHFANGRYLAGPGITLIFSEMDIDGWEVVQRTPFKLEVGICSKDELRKDYKEHIRKVLRHHLGNEVEISIKRVPELRRTKGGKLKRIWKENTNV